MKTPSGRTISIVGLYLACVLVALPDNARAKPDWGGNCASCHSDINGALVVTSTTSLSVSPRLDGGSTASLPCFTVKPGGKVTITLNASIPSGYSYAAAVTGRPSSGLDTVSIASGSVSGVKTSTNNKLIYTPVTPSGWTIRKPSSNTYFTKSGATTNTFVITVDPSTPPDVYSMTCRLTGKASSVKWTDSQEVLIKVKSIGPAVTTGAATSLTSNGTRLNGTINPNGKATTAYFKYGTTTGYGSVTPTQSVGSDNSDASFHASVSHLSAATTYHYRLVAINSSGTAQGADQTFTTLNGPPTAITGTASGLTPEGATLNGTVNSGGHPTTAFFEYGLTAGYGSTTSSQTAGSGSGASAFSAPVGSLNSGTTYHFRLVAINASGTSQGADQTFAIPFPPPVVTTEPATGMNTHEASLNGTINPNGPPAKFFFQYGTTTSYGNITSLQLTSSGTASVPVSLTVGLASAALYHYRLVATSGTYFVTGSDMTFAITRATPSTDAGAQGDAAPLISGSARFLSFGSPAINDGDPGDPGDAGHWAFQATVTGTGITRNNNSGIWLFSNSTSELIARTGDSAPGGGTFATLRDPLLNNHNQVAFLGTVSGTGYDSKNNLGIWSNASGALQLVARTQGQPLDASGVKAASFVQAVLPDNGGVVFLANLVKGTGGCDSTNNQGIWAETNGQLKQLVRKGDTIAGNTIASLSIFSSPVIPTGVAGQTRSFNSGGNLGFQAKFANGSFGNYVLTSGTVLTEVAATGTDAPPVFGAPAKFTLLGSPIINDGDNTAFKALISGTTKATAKLSAILAESGTSHDLEIMALTGTHAPDANGQTGGAGVFAVLGDPVFNSNDQVAFIGKLRTGGTVTTANSQGVWAGKSGALALVARAQGQAPDCPQGTRFLSFVQLVLPDQGGAVFLANLVKGAGGTTTGNNQGIWAVDTGGNLRLIIRKGDMLTVGGTSKTVASLSIFTSSLGAKGQSRSFNKAGDLIFKVTFTDKTQAIRKVVFP